MKKMGTVNLFVLDDNEHEDNHFLNEERFGKETCLYLSPIDGNRLGLIVKEKYNPLHIYYLPDDETKNLLDSLNESDELLKNELVEKQKYILELEQKCSELKSNTQIMSDELTELEKLLSQNQFLKFLQYL